MNLCTWQLERSVAYMIQMLFFVTVHHSTVAALSCWCIIMVNFCQICRNIANFCVLDGAVLVFNLSEYLNVYIQCVILSVLCLSLSVYLSFFLLRCCLVSFTCICQLYYYSSTTVVPLYCYCSITIVVQLYFNCSSTVCYVCMYVCVLFRVALDIDISNPTGDAFLNSEPDFHMRPSALLPLELILLHFILSL